jgi:hypothetical protein
VHTDQNPKKDGENLLGASTVFICSQSVAGSSHLCVMFPKSQFDPWVLVPTLDLPCPCKHRSSAAKCKANSRLEQAPSAQIVLLDVLLAEIV